MRVCVVAATLVWLALPCTAPAQTSTLTRSNPTSPLARGDHVRLLLTGDTAVRFGRVVRADTDHVVVAGDDSGSTPKTIELAQIRRVEVERDARSRSIAATVAGVVGAALGGSYYYFGLCHQDSAGCAREQARANEAARYDDTYVTLGDALVLGGMLAGGLLGYALAPAPHWEIVAVPRLEHWPDGAHASLRIGIERSFLGR